MNKKAIKTRQDVLPYFIGEKAFPNIKYISTHKTKGKYTLILQHKNWRASLVVQWLGIRLPMQGTRVRAPVQEDPTCRGAARPVSHNY